MTSLNFNEIFNKWNESTKKIFSHDRSQTVGASEVFGCLRQVFFKKRGKDLGYEKDKDNDDSWGASKRGDLLENHYIVPALRDFLPEGAKLLFSGEDQKTLFHNKNSATPDGLIVGLEKDALIDFGIPDIKSDCVVIEMKTIDPRVGLKEEKIIHHGQAQIQMGIFRENTKYKPYYAVILYVDASFLDNIKPFIVEYDQSKWEAAQKRANTIWEYDDPKQFRPEGKFDDSCGFCEYKKACSLVTIGSIPPEEKKSTYSDEGREEVGKLVKEIKELETKMELEKKSVEEKKYEVKRILEREKTRKMQAEDRKWRITWFSQAGKKTVDMEALKETLKEHEIDIEDFMKEGKPFDTLRITEAY